MRDFKKQSHFAVPLFLLGVIAIVACLLGGCSNGEKATGPASSLSQENGTQEKIVVLTWAEYFSPKVIEEFETETGIAVEFVYFENLEEMKGILQSRPRAFDVVVSDGGDWLTSSICSYCNPSSAN